MSTSDTVDPAVQIFMMMRVARDNPAPAARAPVPAESR